jgi:asparagine synthase (glutamine-hydrolysing)
MVSGSGRAVIVFNGEIYNFEELGDRLRRDGVQLRGRSDTEVLLESCARYGVAETVRVLNGIFAFAYFDLIDQTMFLVRDRVGVKPLYWALFGRGLVFGSELKAIFAVEELPLSIDHDSVASFLQFGYIAAPDTIVREAHKLEPGCLMRISAGGHREIERYWQVSDAVENGRRAPFEGGLEDASLELEKYLSAAVRRQMVSDVPLGAFLSGGVDSSTVVALMQRHSTVPTRTFSLGFSESEYDESAHALRVARHLGTEHTELRVTPSEALDVIAQLPTMFDEPFSDSSQIPTYLVSKLTRNHVTVALSGDGGDELFSGYSRYALIERRAKALGVIPKQLRSRVRQVAALLPLDLLERTSHRALSSNRARNALGMLGDNTGLDLYRRAVSMWPETDQVAMSGVPRRSAAWGGPGGRTDVSQLDMQLVDIQTYLPEDILTKVDRASMAVGLEARVPLLDSEVIDFAFRLRAEHRVQGSSTKAVLRRVLHRFVPAELVERPKMGFAVPLAQWLRGPLRAWAEVLLSQVNLEGDGLLRASRVRQTWQAHVINGVDESFRLWPILMLCQWAATFKNRVRFGV